MFNPRLFNVRDVLMIGCIVIIVHMVAKPLYSAINSRMSSDD